MKAIRGTSIVLLLFVERILEMGTKNAEDRLHLLFCSLDTRKKLSEIEQAVQILLAADVVWILNRLKDGLEEVHSRDLLLYGGSRLVASAEKSSRGF